MTQGFSTARRTGTSPRLSAGEGDSAPGTVTELHRWPVKSLRGEPVPAARFDERGMSGDRAFALLDERPNRAGKVLTVRQNPAMLWWGANYGANEPDPNGPPTVVAPDCSRWSWDDPALSGVLTNSLNIPLRTHAAVGQQDRGPTVLVTFEASLAALRAELGSTVDLLRFRPNLHLDTAMEPFAEQDWQQGARLAVGPVTLEVTGEDAGPCTRCAVPSWDRAGRERWPELQKHVLDRHDNQFGVIMRVTTPGLVRLGDAVRHH